MQQTYRGSAYSGERRSVRLGETYCLSTWKIDVLTSSMSASEQTPRSVRMYSPDKNRSAGTVSTKRAPDSVVCGFSACWLKDVVGMAVRVAQLRRYGWA